MNQRIGTVILTKTVSKKTLKKQPFTAKLMINPSNQEKYLLVAGGVDASNVPLDSVELLKIGSNSWQTGKE
jgi:hypothetical protein